VGTFRRNRKNRSRIAPIALTLIATVAATPPIRFNRTGPDPRLCFGPTPPSTCPVRRAMEQACGQGPTADCQAAVVWGIDQARAAEGVGPLHLPSDYDTLNVPAQLLVLTDLERVDRGLPGFTALSANLDGLAKTGAVANTDPNGPAGRTWGSNWAGGEPSALLADYDLCTTTGLGRRTSTAPGPHPTAAGTIA